MGNRMSCNSDNGKVSYGDFNNAESSGDCAPLTTPQLVVEDPCCEPGNKNRKLTDNSDSGVKQAFDGPRKGIHDGVSSLDGTNREQGVATLNYYNGCSSWKDIKYLQPLDIDNIFETPRSEYDNYNRSRLKLKQLRDIYTH